MPTRIQLKRTKGWRMPPNTVKVDRSGPWGNPFRVLPPEVRDVEHSVELFENWLQTTAEGQAMAERAREELRGKNLACWCREGSACHGDVLLRVANPTI